MATRKAITVVAEKTTGVTDVPIPKPGPDWVLTKVKAVSLNPTDWKHVEWGAADTGAILGCDYYGIVEEVGNNVTKFKKGDRIAGFTHGGYADSYSLFSNPLPDGDAAV
jgi:NADPH:quinone reductase-like Zn-dependent oxidoreductase